MKGGRIINFFFTITFIALAVFAGIYLYRDYQHLDHLKSDMQMLENRQESLKKESALRAEKLARLDHDSEYVEKVIRQKLNYAKEDEDVFRFE